MQFVLMLFESVFRLIGLFLFEFYGWVLIVLFFGYLIWQNKRKEQWVKETEQMLLLIEVPKDNDKKELSAEQMFASLHGILRPKSELTKEGSLQEHISFEIASVGNKIQFYVWVPKHLKDFVEGQIYAQYPSVQIKEGAEDYSRCEVGDRIIHGTELVLTKKDVVPIKTFASFEVDPLAGITAVLAKLEDSGEEMWIQVLARPIDDSWQDTGHKYMEEIKNGKAKGLSSMLGESLLQLPIYILQNFVRALWEPPTSTDTKGGDKKELSTGQQTLIKAVEAKTTKLGYDVKIRIAYLGPDETLGRQRVQAIVGGFKQFNTTNLNGFTTKKVFKDESFLDEYRARLFFDRGFTLNIEELASLYHLPHTSVETPNLVWTTTKTAEPPSNLPSEAITTSNEVSLFGVTNFRGGKIKFGIRRADRGRHLYIVGQTGTGKSFLLELLTLSDIYHDHGFAIIDPHGDFASDMLRYIPEHRLKDVIYFNPADRDFPIGFNPLEVLDEGSKHHISSELVGVLKRMFDSWGPRLEYILRYTILALLDYPDATMLGINRMLTEKGYRNKVIKQIQDPVVKNFWVNEYASWNEKFANEAVAPVLNKVGAFTANPLIRNVIGQPKSNINLRKLMDEGKILIVNLSRGQVGEDNASVLGAMMVTKIQLAAMSRADMPMSERRPFYLYVDEFQNFATDSFAVILSEARKYGLNLTVANQYVAQMPETVREAVFGNVGSMITFRVGAGDSAYLGKYFEPVFEAGDLTKLHNQHIFVSMIVEGEKTIPFSAATLRMPAPEHDYTEQIIQLSREAYAKPRAEVEENIKRWSLSGGDDGTGQTQISGEQKPNILQELRNPNISHSHAAHQDRDHGPRMQERRRVERREDNRGGQGHRGRPTQPQGGGQAHGGSQARNSNAHANSQQNHQTHQTQSQPQHQQPEKREQAVVGAGDIQAGESISLRK